MKKLNMNLGSITSNIIIEKGIIKNAGREIRKVYSSNKIAVVTDENVFGLYGEILEKSLAAENFTPTFIVIKPGEQSKTVDTLKHVYSNLVSMGITRGDLIVALGGGVVGDLAGFAASTYLRGIDFVQIPTSLLAQIDSSIGGKVAVNLDEGKNLIGSFYHPKLVLVDPEVLNSLPEKFVKDGLGEAIKYGCIRDKELFSMLLDIKSNFELLDNIEDIIFRCLSIKKETVEMDEKDKGIRMLLNFGHTIGHAIEKYFNYEKYSHGEAVSVGMYWITKKSEEMGITEKGTSDKIKGALENYGIEYTIPHLDREEIIKNILVDKKNISGKLNLILLKDIGNAFIYTIPEQETSKFI
ncbi:MAG: 3-dehydroquinate synthase [Sedimentibacter saalensis]|jgi:3-dehydroquinate synthase|uniref:3-dehydroquinate synthase n=1 Tax=Sedimentibacter saalensis TaxID=130788 RepID=UPI002B20D6A8|nr:3-dehydroquinate synthase [Sedimentibacter saalensis]MEA5095357.1 3-dehydroquinate synthase [Sedimentibacter saalensis]